MANHILVPVYEALYQEPFDYSDFEKRMKMQKAVYLLQEMGVPMGEYGFRWYLHGPYSQDLQDDMYEENLRSREGAAIPLDYQAEVSRLREVLTAVRPAVYSDADWAECLGSMYYLQKHNLSSKAKPEDVIGKLRECKTHLNDDEANVAAYNALKELFAV